ncbi:hypothetical protein CAPTEDRAFT_199345 [Capitella teleta]|uniref:Uncharacterized protein n=1 Tax=Capitella teleta TaxID=283909 RepID=R7U0V1_CAPTE|nr:hypothetical protein CAPTEDRAFT_199345 [Capitella teleta]|eukprot:ELT97286.1 hypothetical protein CAPTEDRAFT_199345 [Capitella teleta]
MDQLLPRLRNSTSVTSVRYASISPKTSVPSCSTVGDRDLCLSRYLMQERCALVVDDLRALHVTVDFVHRRPVDVSGTGCFSKFHCFIDNTCSGVLSSVDQIGGSIEHKMITGFDIYEEVVKTIRFRYRLHWHIDLVQALRDIETREKFGRRDMM